MNKPQLFCFTYAGGNAAFFDEIAHDLPEIEVTAPEYPGHGTRHKEPFCKDFGALAADVFSALQKQYRGGRYGLFGYSMGTITLVEVLKCIAESDMPMPAYVFLGAHEPHTKAELSGFDAGELDDLVKERTIAFGAVPERLRENRSFWRMYLPLYRADYSMIGGYRFEDLHLQSSVPAAVFYSETDTPFRDMAGWKQIFTDTCEFFAFEGMHFFIKAHHSEMAAVIRERLSPDNEVKNDL